MNQLILILIILFTALTRLIPHPPNFTPIIAIGLFSGALIKDYKFSFLIPLFAMLISDYILGFHIVMPWIYISIISIAILGRLLLKKKINIYNCILSILGGSLLFFIISNFGVWAIGGYEKSFPGLIACYIMAIPFYYNTLAGTTFYVFILFGLHAIVKYSNQNSVKKQYN